MGPRGRPRGSPSSMIELIMLLLGPEDALLRRRVQVSVARLLGAFIWGLIRRTFAPKRPFAIPGRDPGQELDQRAEGAGENRSGSDRAIAKPLGVREGRGFLGTGRRKMIVNRDRTDRDHRSARIGSRAGTAEQPAFSGMKVWNGPGQVDRGNRPRRRKRCPVKRAGKEPARKTCPGLVEETPNNVGRTGSRPSSTSCSTCLREVDTEARFPATKNLQESQERIQSGCRALRCAVIGRAGRPGLGAPWLGFRAPKPDSGPASLPGGHVRGLYGRAHSTSLASSPDRHGGGGARSHSLARPREERASPNTSSGRLFVPRRSCQ